MFDLLLTVLTLGVIATALLIYVTALVGWLRR